MKKIPYGISNFKIMRKENYLYVDKTKYIQILEDYAPYQFFIRPRRFGKSLFVSMLESYYDINAEKDFEELFGGLYIGKNPTPRRNQYLIFKISFAGIDTSSGEEKLKQSFNFKVMSAAQEFLDKYGGLIHETTLPEEVKSAETAIEYLRRIAKKAEKQVMVLIDEYDNFANELITGGERQTYENLMHGEGLVKAFYKAIKDATMDNFTRLFMTGVSPIMIDDLTSGFNITENLTLKPTLNAMLGFTQHETEEILKLYDIYSQETIEDMKKYYNGYRFSPVAEEYVYNSDMCLYFIKDMAEYKRYPMSMIDNNVKTDYSRVNQLALNFKDSETLETIMTQGQISTVLVERFNLSTMYSKKENFASLLFYLGMLTIKEPFEDMVKLCIPNYVIRTIYWNQFYDILQKELDIQSNTLKTCIRQMRTNGDITSFIEFFKGLVSNLSNRDLIGMNEKGIKMILTTLFGVDGTYMVLSEQENTEGYTDIFLQKKVQYKAYTKYQWILELKYLKESERQRLEEVRERGLSQLKSYAESVKVKQGIKPEELKQALIIVVGKKDVYCGTGN
ncbi:MAG TPA: AAA family ATPase [Thermoanaerobacterales bacterium]|nr:AAA family ATPase [Thermoanaerobacterales bacterium]